MMVFYHRKAGKGLSCGRTLQIGTENLRNKAQELVYNEERRPVRQQKSGKPMLDEKSGLSVNKRTKTTSHLL